MRSKILFVAVLLLCCSMSGYSQTEKGKFIVGGIVNPSFSAFDKLRNSKVGGEVRGGYFILNNYSIGLSFDLLISRSKNTSNPYEDRLNAYSFNLFNRYYVRKDKLGLFAEGGIGFGVFQSKTGLTLMGQKNYLESNQNYLTLKGGIGADYFLTSNVALELLLSYNYNDVEQNPLYYYPKHALVGNIGFMVFLP